MRANRLAQKTVLFKIGIRIRGSKKSDTSEAFATYDPYSQECIVYWQITRGKNVIVENRAQHGRA